LLRVDNAQRATNRQPTTREAKTMNLYLLLAIAIGAISGTAEVPVARTSFAAVAAECGVRSSEQAIASPRSTQHHARSESTAPRVIEEAPARIEAPLAGAATPRAPASDC
jgi:hypothetical protein